MNKSIPLIELAAAVADVAGTGERLSELFLKELFATVSQVLIDRDSVTINGLGSFFLQSGEDNKDTVIFTPDESLASQVNTPFDRFEPIGLDDNVTDDVIAALTDSDFGVDSKQQTVEDIEDDAQQISEVAETTPPLETTSESEVIQPSQQPIEDENETETVINEILPNVEKSSEPIDNIEQTVVKSEKPKTANQEKTNNSSRNPFLRGMIAGAAIVAAGLLIWWLSTGKSNNNADNDIAQYLTETANESANIKDKISIVTDTTSTTNVLTKISTRHYGRQEFWVYIYLENKDKIADPNNIPNGTVLIIPPAEKYKINPNDNESINRANNEAFTAYTKLLQHN